MNSKQQPDDELTARRWAAVSRTVRARIAELRWPVSTVGELSGLSVTTIKAVIRATSRSNPSTLVALSAALGWDPQYLNTIVHGRAAPDATLASQNALLMRQITGMRAEIAGLTQASYRTNMKIETLIRRIDTLIGPPTGQGSPAHGMSPRLAGAKARRALPLSLRQAGR